MLNLALNRVKKNARGFFVHMFSSPQKIGRKLVVKKLSVLLDCVPSIRQFGVKNTFLTI